MPRRSLNTNSEAQQERFFRNSVRRKEAEIRNRDQLERQTLGTVGAANARRRRRDVNQTQATRLGGGVGKVVHKFSDGGILGIGRNNPGSNSSSSALRSVLIGIKPRQASRAMSGLATEPTFFDQSVLPTARQNVDSQLLGLAGRPDPQALQQQQRVSQLVEDNRDKLSGFLGNQASVADRQQAVARELQKRRLQQQLQR